MAELEEFKAQAEVEEQNIALVKRLCEEMNKGNDEIFSELHAPDYAFYYPSNRPKPASSEGVQEYFKMLFKAFPDINLDIQDIIAKGDMVTARFISKGTQKEDWYGVPATGNKIEVSAIHIFRLKNGKIVEQREEWSILGFYKQLGFELKPKEGEK